MGFLGSVCRCSGALLAIPIAVIVAAAREELDSQHRSKDPRLNPPEALGPPSPAPKPKARDPKRNDQPRHFPESLELEKLGMS